MKGTKPERQRIERENRVTGADLLKLSEAALQRQLPLFTEFQTWRVTLTHQSIETKTLPNCSPRKLWTVFDNLVVEVTEVVDAQKTGIQILSMPVVWHGVSIKNNNKKNPRSPRTDSAFCSPYIHVSFFMQVCLPIAEKTQTEKIPQHARIRSQSLWNEISSLKTRMNKRHFHPLQSQHTKQPLPALQWEPSSVVLYRSFPRNRDRQNKERKKHNRSRFYTNLRRIINTYIKRLCEVECQHLSAFESTQHTLMWVFKAITSSQKEENHQVLPA